MVIFHHIFYYHYGTFPTDYIEYIGNKNKDFIKLTRYSQKEFDWCKACGDICHRELKAYANLMNNNFDHIQVTKTR